MKKFVSIFFLLGLIYLSTILHAQDKSFRQTNPPVTLHRAEIINIISKINGQTYPIKIALPGSYYVSNRTYPVVYLLDAYSTFGTVTEMARLLASDKELPEIIIVGISSEGGSKEFIYNRSRDYTPTQITQEDLPDSLRVSVPVSGGGESFLKFIKEELIPLVESKYRTVSGDRTLAGHSLGGLFVFYSIFQEPYLFKRYVAVSPALAWDDGFVMKQEKKFYDKNKTLNATVYTAVGSLESHTFTQPWTEFTNTLRKHEYSGLKLKTEIAMDETHYTIIPYVVTHGLKSVFTKNFK